jgi:hypothetical protein
MQRVYRCILIAALGKKRKKKEGLFALLLCFPSAPAAAHRPTD